MREDLDIKNIPKLPGCYIFKNKQGGIIYIGKSKSLNNRVRQYFHAAAPLGHRKYAGLIKEIHRVETIVTDSETNALILECQLIKEHKPKYNSQLKKVKVYPFIRIDTGSLYPSLTITDSQTKSLFTISLSSDFRAFFRQTRKARRRIFEDNLLGAPDDV